MLAPKEYYQKNIYSNILTFLPGDGTIISLPTIIFRTWHLNPVINSVINGVIYAEKIPWTQSLFRIKGNQGL